MGARPSRSPRWRRSGRSRIGAGSACSWPRAADLAQAPAGTLQDIGPELHSFADTAAALCQLDPVVTAHTAVAHLAGALGPLVMLPYAPDWRGLCRGDRCAWCPSLTLFRQDARRAWGRAVEAIAAAGLFRGGWLPCRTLSLPTISRVGCAAAVHPSM
jgi:hypothetical protein